MDDDFLLKLLQACAARAPAPLYPALYAKEHRLDRDKLDQGLDELRRRGLIQLTDWVKDLGQGRTLTEAGKQALTSKRLTAVRPPTPTASVADVRRNRYERGEVVRGALTEPRTPYASRTLLIINVIVFAYGAFHAWLHDYSVGEYLAGKGAGILDTLIDLGGLHPALVFRAHPPQFERLLLHAFLHFGFLHLVLNMAFLVTLAPAIEAMWGTVRFLAIYFVSTLVGGCVVLSAAFVQGAGPLTAGASGALYGLFIAMIVWFLLNREHLPDDYLQRLGRRLAPNILLMVLINFVPHVSWQDHLGGAIGGLLAALLLHVHRFHPSRTARLLALVGVPLVPIAFFVVLLWQAGWF